MCWENVLGAAYVNEDLVELRGRIVNAEDVVDVGGLAGRKNADAMSVQSGERGLVELARA